MNGSAAVPMRRNSSIRPRITINSINQITITSERFQEGLNDRDMQDFNLHLRVAKIWSASATCRSSQPRRIR